MPFPLTPTLLILLALAALIWVVASYYESASVRRSARELSDENQNRETNPPEIIKANPADYPWLDIGFYDQSEKRLHELGFTRIADIENVTETRGCPYMQRFARWMRNADGTVLASIVMITVHRRRMPLHLRWLPVKPGRLVSLSSKTADGIRLSTHNTAGLAPPADVPGYVLVGLTPETPIEQLLDRHRSMLTDITETDPATEFTPCMSLDELKREFAAEHEWLKSCNAYQQITRSAIAFTGQDNEDLADASDRIGQAYEREQQRRNAVRSDQS